MTDRFQSEPYAAYRRSSDSPDFAANVCENCDRGSESPLHYVPEYKMHACDVCYDEAMSILAEEAAEAAAVARRAA